MVHKDVLEGPFLVVFHRYRYLYRYQKKISVSGIGISINSDISIGIGMIENRISVSVLVWKFNDIHMISNYLNIKFIDLITVSV